MDIVWQINGFNIITLAAVILGSIINWVIVQRLKWNDFKHFTDKFKEHCDESEKDFEKIEKQIKEGCEKLEKQNEKAEKQNREDHKKIFSTQETHEGRISNIEGRLNRKSKK